MIDIDDGALSDNEVRPHSHKKLLAAIKGLNTNNTRHIKAPTRSEPILSRNEFNLVKGGTHSKSSSVHVDDLVKALTKTSKHLNIGKELKKTKSNKKLLDKPLEKHVTEKIQRSLGYDKTKEQLARWDAVVTRHRASDNMQFPLLDRDLSMEINAPPKNSDFRIKSDLWLAMDALQKDKPDKTAEEYAKEMAEETATLSREEMVERRNELRRLRVLEAQKGAKARRQNKIKSKKFHKLMKQEKLKVEMKEFDELQKRDPEAALHKLEELEKNRVKERATQRHRNTGTWAQNLKVRAKYDKDVRFELAQQVALSRELTAKNKAAADESDEEQQDDQKMTNEELDPFNPWVKKMKQNASAAGGEVEDFVSGYKKYWEERNENERKLKEYRNEDVLNEEEDDNEDEKENGEYHTENGILNEEEDEEEQAPAIEKKKKVKSATKIVKSTKMNWSVEDAEDLKPSTESITLEEYQKCKLLKKKTTKRKIPDLDDIFDAAEEAVRTKLTRKMGNLKSALGRKPKANTKKSKSKDEGVKSLEALSFKNTTNRPTIDDEMSETTRRNGVKSSDNLTKLKNAANNITDDRPEKTEEQLNPENFVKVKPKQLHTAIPDTFNTDEIEDAETILDQKRMTIAEAFEDDDIVADFQRDKDDTRKADQLADIDLTLPGWGSWAGSGIKKRAPKVKLQFDKNLPRKDDRHQAVIINEKPNEKMRGHQISEMPFPFTSVRDLEASIRAPVSTAFIPYKSSKLLTMPAVETKIGTIIEPMNEAMLLKREAPTKSMIEERIAKLKTKTAEKKRKHKSLA